MDFSYRIPDIEEPEAVPDDAPRKYLPVSDREENAILRVERRIGRPLNHGEAWKIVEPIRFERFTNRPVMRFIDRVKTCPKCRRKHAKTDPFCGDCIPF